MKLTFRITVGALAATFLVWAAYLLAVTHFFTGDWAKSGQFGDTFGGLNTFFTGCAAVVVLATLFQQSKQIEDTKNELKEERELQKKTIELVAQQATALTEVARLNALTSRIEAYTVQIEDAHDGGNHELAKTLVAERRTLLVKLDGVLRSHGD